MLPVGERTAAPEDGAGVAAEAATTEQEDVAEGDKHQGEEEEAMSQVTRVSAWEGVLEESGQIQQPERGKATAALSPQVQPVQV